MVDTSQAVVSSDGSKSELYDTTNIDVYVWLDDQCLAFIFFSPLQFCSSAGLDVTWDLPLILSCMSFFYLLQ